MVIFRVIAIVLHLCHTHFQALGSGFEVISVGKKKLIRSVPTELNKDHNEILELAQVCVYLPSITVCIIALFCLHSTVRHILVQLVYRYNEVDTSLSLLGLEDYILA